MSRLEVLPFDAKNPRRRVENAADNANAVVGAKHPWRHLDEPMPARELLVRKNENKNESPGKVQAELDIFSAMKSTELVISFI